MDPWQQLFKDVQAEDDKAANLAAAQRRREEAYAGLAERLMKDLAARARTRADELKERTSRVVGVDYPSHRPVDVLDDRGAFMSALRLRTGTASVTLYSHREPGRPPSLHLLGVPKDGDAGARRLASEPVCIAALINDKDEDYELRALPANRDDATTRPVSADEVLLRAFQRLLGLPARTP